MKIYFTLIISAILLAVPLSDVFTNAAQPPAARTGAPGENICSTGCHTNSSGGSGTVSITFGSGDVKYFGDSIYDVSVSVNDATMNTFGFEITALDANNNKAGTFSITNTANTAIATAGGREYVSHKNAGTNNTWSFTWKSPSTNVGNVTFYASAIAANGDNTNQGDKLYLGQLSISADPSVSIQKLSLNKSFKIYPQPVMHEVNITLPAAQKSHIKIFDITGKTLFSKKYTASEITVPTENIKPGVYFLLIETETKHWVEKIIKQ